MISNYTRGPVQNDMKHIFDYVKNNKIIIHGKVSENKKYVI